MGVEKNYKRLAREFWLNKFVPACVGDFLSGYFTNVARINSFADSPGPGGLGFIKPSRRGASSLTSSDYLGFVSDSQFLQLESMFGSPQSGYRMEKAAAVMNTLQEFLSKDKEYSYLYWLREGIAQDGIAGYLPKHADGAASTIDGGPCQLSQWDVELSLIMAQTVGFYKKAMTQPLRARSYSYTLRGVPNQRVYVYGRVVESSTAPLSYEVIPVSAPWLVSKSLPMLGWIASPPGPTDPSFLDKTVGDLRPLGPGVSHEVIPTVTPFQSNGNMAVAEYNFQLFIDRVARNFRPKIEAHGRDLIDSILRNMEQQG